MKTVIFDLDGTLADTSGDLIAAANACFRRMGHRDVLTVEHDKGTAMMGGGRAMLQLGFERLGLTPKFQEIEENYPVLLKAYEENIAVHTMLYPGCAAAVERLLSDGYVVGVCTNKPEGLADILLQRLRVRDLFASLVGADTLDVRKPDPLPLVTAVELAGGKIERTVLVGDTTTDRDTARSAGAKSLLVTFGPDGYGVESLQPDALLHHYEDLSQVISRLIG